MIGLAAISNRSLADGPVLHEFIPPDPGEDLTLRATTQDGRMAAAVLLVQALGGGWNVSQLP